MALKTFTYEIIQKIIFCLNLLISLLPTGLERNSQPSRTVQKKFKNPYIIKLVSKWKAGNRKWQRSFFVFLFCNSKIVTNDSDFYSALGQFLIFKPFSYCFEETMGFDVKPSFASRPLSRLTRHITTQMI